MTASRDLFRMTATALAERLGRREISAFEVIASHLERIRDREPLIRAWAIIDADRALERARELDRGPIVGPLHGLPIAVKDVIDTADFPTERGSPIYRGRHPAADAACVDAARRAGAIVLGKSVTTELAAFKPAATVNPRNFAHTPGGSSSGSAAAVADEMVPLAFGTQTFGSVIRPASYCGVVGYKPSFGTIPTDGVLRLAESLDTVGVFARSVDDAALLAGVAAGRSDLVEIVPRTAPPRIGICRTYEWSAVDDAGRDALERAATELARSGARIRTVELPAPFADLGAACEDIYGFELSRNLADVRRMHAALLSDGFRGSIDAGTRVSHERYARAQRVASACRAAFAGVLAELDVLLTPSTTGEAPLGLDTTGSPIMNRNFTLLHAPAVNVPALSSPRGLPVGLQVVGGLGDDRRALSAAKWIHERLAGPL
ncbi:MAG: amidase [Gammaproteobacteria bacterium]|nr:amidase [Gammaproteobacteria bacterium]